MKKYVIAAIIILVVYLVFFHKKTAVSTTAEEKLKQMAEFDPITGFIVNNGAITGGGFVKPAGTSVTSAVTPLVRPIRDLINNGSTLAQP